MPNWGKIEHFNRDEFGHGEPGVEPDELLVRMLDQARATSGIPYQITSGLRTHVDNERVGGAPSSSHLTGYAVDIATPTSSHRFLVLLGVFHAGFRRVGIYERHVHVDVDPHKPQGVAWHV